MNVVDLHCIVMNAQDWIFTDTYGYCLLDMRFMWLSKPLCPCLTLASVGVASDFGIVGVNVGFRAHGCTFVWVEGIKGGSMRLTCMGFGGKL